MAPAWNLALCQALEDRGDMMTPCFWEAQHLGGKSHFTAPATHWPVGWGARFSDFSRIFRNIRKPNSYIFSHKTTLPSFKRWQLSQILIYHCVGQIKHAWRLNLAHRPPVCDLCSRRRTELQFGWNKAVGLEFPSPTPPLCSCKSGRQRMRTLVLGKEKLKKLYGRQLGEGVHAT